MTKLNDESPPGKAPTLAAADPNGATDATADRAGPADPEPDARAIRRGQRAAWRAWARAHRQLLRLAVYVMRRSSSLGLAKAIANASLVDDARRYSLEDRLRVTVTLYEELCAVGSGGALECLKGRGELTTPWAWVDACEQVGDAIGAATACLRLLSVERSDLAAWCRQLAWGEQGFDDCAEAARERGYVPLRPDVDIADLLGRSTAWVEAEVERGAGR